MYFLFSYDISALTADKLAKEALMVFLDSRVVSNFCSFDYSDQFADWGEVVNVHKISETSAQRIPEGNPLVVSTKGATGDTIKLNQHLAHAFEVTDREAQRSFVELINTYVAPGMRAMAEKADLIVQGEKYNSYLYTAGQLGVDVDFDSLVDLKTVQTLQKIPLAGRNLVVTPTTSGQFLKEDKLTRADALGEGSRLLTGIVGSGSGYNIFETTSLAEITETDVTEGALTSDYAAGTTVLALDGITGTWTAGFWVTINGYAYRTTAKSDTTGNLTGITIQGGLKAAAANNDVVRVYEPALVNLLAGYALDYQDTIVYDGTTLDPVVGQGVSTGTAGPVYGIVDVDTSAKTILLNRPLEAALANNDELFLMPAGNWNWAMNRNAVQVVNRPMTPPPAGRGVESAIAAFENWSVRVTISYNHTYMKNLVSIDMLMGVRTINPNYNALLLG